MKKIIMMTLMLLGAVTLLGNNDALAGKPYGHMKGEQNFDAMDTDKDGKISKEEHMVKAKERFEAMDTDNDGFLTREECRKTWEERKEGMMEKMKEKRFQKQGATSPTDVSPEELKPKSE
ncbi:MAG: EF-hand domain-containing protein [Desulfobacterales bacterium]